MKREKTDTNTEQIVVRVTPELKEKVEAYCQANGISIAEAVRCWAITLPEMKGKRRDTSRKPLSSPPPRHEADP